MTPLAGSTDSYEEVGRFAGMCRGPVWLLATEEELGDVDEVVAVTGTTVMLTEFGEDTGVLTVGAGGGLSSYRLPFIMDHQPTPVAVPALELAAVASIPIAPIVPP